MDIVSDLPFKLQLIKRFPAMTIQNAEIFYTDEHEMWSQDIATLSAEENDEIEMLFESDDDKARLYLEALDIMPQDDINIREDETGDIYRIPSNKTFVLYKSNAEYDALRVDVFKIKIYCNNMWFFGTFQILPKPISSQEWIMMKEDLEIEIRGLAQDIVRRNIGIGELKEGNIPPQIIYDFLVIRKYSKNVLNALVEIADNPRYAIKTQYENVYENKKFSFDAETVKRYVTKSGSETTFKVPVKKTNYNIQDNRLLKMIIKEYDKKIDIFLELLETINRYSQDVNAGTSVQYKNVWKQSISDFEKTALKLRKMTSVIKTQKWYLEVSDKALPYISHSFIMDTRYNTLYQMYLALKKEDMQIELDPEFSYTWKRSSYLYEMWCYFKICHIMALNFEVANRNWEFVFSDKVLFPFLESGTEVAFENNDIIIQVIFDKLLPARRNDTSEKVPLFIVQHHGSLKNHNRPDIVINMYDKRKSWYLGTIIVECKYRKLTSFWSGSSTRSSRGQLEAYYNNARSKYLYGTIGEEMQINPVRKVIVLTPDIYGEGTKQDEYKIMIKSFKPSKDESMIMSLQEEMLSEIRKTKKRADWLYGKPVYIAGSKM